MLDIHFYVLHGQYNHLHISVSMLKNTDELYFAYLWYFPGMGSISNFWKDAYLHSMNSGLVD